MPFCKVNQGPKTRQRESHHLKENCRSHRHPVELDLEGRIQGEVAMIVAAAPLQSVCAVIHIHVQGHSPLLWDSGSYVSTQEKPREGGERGSGMRRKISRYEMADSPNRKLQVLKASWKSPSPGVGKLFL